MKKIVSILALGLLLAATAFAADAEYSFREGVRTGVVTSLFSVAVSAPGNMAVATNLTVGGTATVTGNSTINGTLTVRTNAFTVSATGVGSFAGDVTMDKPIFRNAAVAAPTNTASQGFIITVDGTDYVIALYPN
jgi:hypothetical protein